MAFKQPKVPEYHGTEKTETYIRRLTLFLRDFCQEVWKQSQNDGKALTQVREEMGQVEHPVQSVNGKTGEVTLTPADVGAVTTINGAEPDAAGNVNITMLPSYDGTSFLEAQASEGYIRGFATWTNVNGTWWRVMTYGEPDTKRWHVSLYDQSKDVWYDRTMLTMDQIYPVGAIYISAGSTSPASLFGGTWEQLKDRFLLGAGGSYAAGQTGGEAAHTLSVSEMPAHNHRIIRPQWYYSDSDVENNNSGAILAPKNTSKSYFSQDHEITSTGGGEAHNNMPPYLAVYMWRRVS